MENFSPLALKLQELLKIQWPMETLFGHYFFNLDSEILDFPIILGQGHAEFWRIGAISISLFRWLFAQLYNTPGSLNPSTPGLI